uniref:Uncharacterized protein n=1 Tax=Rhizophora mucronata TaxID=61149 RepID=A0A2P2QSU4_RHIMU
MLSVNERASNGGADELGLVYDAIETTSSFSFIKSGKHVLHVFLHQFLQYKYFFSFF